MVKKWWALLVLFILIVSTSSAVDTDEDGLLDSEEDEGWVVEAYDCNNTKISSWKTSNKTKVHTDDLCTEDEFHPGNNTWGDCADDYGERLWDLDPRDIDTDNDGLIDWDYVWGCRYCNPDPCPSHCNNFCSHENATYWEMTVCGECYMNINYNVEVTSSTIKFEGASQGLGEEGREEEDVFVFNVTGTKLPVNVTFKASIYSRTVTLTAVNQTKQALGFEVTLESIDGNEVTLVVQSTSNRNALSFVEFEFPSSVDYSESSYSLCRSLIKMNDHREKLEDYQYKINRLSFVFNAVDLYEARSIFSKYGEWKYNDSDVNFSDDWVDPGFDDSDWGVGDAYLGYNESLITTVLNYSKNGHDAQNKTITYYFRKYFDVDNVSELETIELSVDYDDGFVAYLNGYHLVNSTGSSRDHYQTVPYHESSIGDAPSQWLVYELTSSDKSHFVEGENVLAVEIHQTKHRLAPEGVSNSSDIVLAAYMDNYLNISASGIADNISQMCSILQDDSTEEARLNRELLSLWFNVASSEICYYQFFCDNPSRTECQSDYDFVYDDACDTYTSTESICGEIDACTVSQLISDAEDSLINGQNSEFENFTDQISAINNGKCLDCFPCSPPTRLDVSLAEDNESVFLEWDVTDGDGYRIYYSSDAEKILNFSETGINPGDLESVSVTETNWTDTNASDVQERYYLIASYSAGSSSECVGWQVKGKFTYYMKGNDESPYTRGNWIGIPLSDEIKAGRDIIKKCIGDEPERVLRLERKKQGNRYAFLAHEFDFKGDGFLMTPGEGYSVEVIGSCNVTIVGDLAYDQVNKDLFAGDPLEPNYVETNPYLNTNWVSANFVAGNNWTIQDLFDAIENDAGDELLYLNKSSDGSYTMEHYINGISDNSGHVIRGASYYLRVNDTSEVNLK